MCLFVCTPRKVAQAVVAPVAVAIVAAVAVIVAVVCKHFHFAAALSAFQLAVSSSVINLHLTKFA